MTAAAAGGQRGQSSSGTPARLLLLLLLLWLPSDTTRILQLPRAVDGREVAPRRKEQVECLKTICKVMMKQCKHGRSRAVVKQI